MSSRSARNVLPCLPCYGANGVSHSVDIRAHQGGSSGRQRRAERGCRPPGAEERMRVARKAQAAQFAANILPIIREVQAAGHTSYNAIAGQLNSRKVATANGGRWRCTGAADFGAQPAKKGVESDMGCKALPITLRQLWRIQTKNSRPMRLTRR